MINTLNTEIYKIKSKKGFLIFFISLEILSMIFSAIFASTLTDAGIDNTSNMWNKAGNITLYSIYFLIGVVALTNIVLSSDYIKGTIDTQIISGSDKVNIYISKIIVLIFSVIFSLFISLITIILTMGVAYGFGDWNAEVYSEMSNIFIRMIIHILPFITLYGILGLLIKNGVVASILSFLSITFLILIARFLTKVFNVSEKFIEYMWINLEHLDFRHEESFKGWVLCSIISFLVFLIIGTYIAKLRDYN